jgi:endonuclease/exonuclease/phosphatase family metal-dependent hydrolase
MRAPRGISRVVRIFRLQTWNAFGTAMKLGSMLRGRGAPDAHRLAHPSVRQALHDADVLCMQEVWIADVVELFDALPHPHKIRDHNRWTWWPLTIAGSGLGLASRWPLGGHELRSFRARGVGVERLGRKGWLWARAVRRQQLAEVGRAIAELGSLDRPLLLCGDLNIDGLAAARAGEYAVLAELFPDLVDLGAQADEPTMCPRPELNELAHRYWSHEPVQRLDYVLYRAPRAGGVEIERVERILDQRLEGDAGPATRASDHFGLRIWMKWNDPVSSVTHASLADPGAPRGSGSTPLRGGPR